MSQDVQFIAETVQGIVANVESQETLNKILGSANQYAQLKKFNADKTRWTDEQLDSYFQYLEKMVDMPTVVTQESFDSMSIEEKVQAVGIELEGTDNGAVLEGVLNKMTEQNKYRDDLKCPFCGQMVYDNRNSKRSEKSPDFTCSTNDPVICGGHSGKWRKSWWLDNSDLPKEWNLDGEVKTAQPSAGDDLPPAF
ncbi:hypothetical protein N8814_05405 [Acidimicrobiia bacterium]|nr:hypothetical protein [Acidimicrobiia bacterium]